MIGLSLIGYDFESRIKKIWFGVLMILNPDQFFYARFNKKLLRLCRFILGWSDFHWWFQRIRDVMNVLKACVFLWKECVFLFLSDSMALFSFPRISWLPSGICDMAWSSIIYVGRLKKTVTSKEHFSLTKKVNDY